MCSWAGVVLFIFPVVATFVLLCNILLWNIIYIRLSIFTHISLVFYSGINPNSHIVSSPCCSCCCRRAGLCSHGATVPSSGLTMKSHLFCFSPISNIGFDHDAQVTPNYSGENFRQDGMWTLEMSSFLGSWIWHVEIESISSTNYKTYIKSP